MRGLIVSFLLLCAWSTPASAETVLRASVVPEQAWVGQRVILRVDVLSDAGWAQIRRFADIEIEGGYLLGADSQGTRLQETVDGTAFSGQRYELSIYPQVPGRLEVPAIAVETAATAWGSDAGDRVEQRTTPALTVNVAVPPGAEGISGLISSPRLSAAQAWEPDGDAIGVGDAVRRVVDLEASDVSAMAFAALRFPPIPGVGIYPAEPIVRDSAERGALSGRRTETVSYVFERPGPVQLPDITLAWWNLDAGRLERELLPGRRFDVAAGAPGDSAGADPVGDADPRWYWLPAAVATLGAFLLLRFRRPLLGHWAAWRVRRIASEARYFRRAIRSVQAGDARGALRETMRWLDRIETRDRPAQLRVFVGRYVDADAQLVVDRMLQRVVSGGRLEDPQSLADVLTTARDGWCRASRQGRGALSVLPELNG